jgi:beta-glucosidase
VRNAGGRAGRETVQLYVSMPGAGGAFPIRELRGIRKVALASGEEATVSFELGARDLSSILADGSRVLRPGAYRISVGGHQGDARSAALSGTGVLSATVELRGEPLKMEY